MIDYYKKLDRPTSRNNFTPWYPTANQDPLVSILENMTHGPFGPDRILDAKILIDKKVLCAQKKEGLGYYGVLKAVDNLESPYLVELDPKPGRYYRFKWVVSDE